MADEGPPPPPSASVWTMPADPERFPHVVIRGAAANLSALRGSDAQTRSTFFEERNTHPVALSGDVPALLVEAPIPVRVIVTTSAAAVAEDETGLHGDPTDDHPENDDDREAVSSPDNDDAVSGEVFVTNTQVLFVSETGDEPGSDLAIGGACVVLHAMTDDPEPSVYLQLSSSSDHDDGTGVVTEVTFVPSSGGSSDCDRLFEALCRLISLHPVEGDDDDGDDDGMFGGAMIGGGVGDDPFGDYGEAVDGLVWAPPPSTDDGPVATNREREAMLEHLDNLLVVAPGLEAKDDNDKGGQFEDAPES